ncbi:MAG: type III pantothenate kinase [Sulfurospirillum sp.]|nr:type III pantothenate kinase [Sulfurospirillum sp.]
MILCDIGNSTVGMYHDGKIWTLSHNEFKNYSNKENIFYISVNDAMSNYLQDKKNFKNLEPFFIFDTIYQGIGIDRIAACSTVKDGIVIDAGSAITVDIMSNGMHLGGYILPGLSAYQKSYEMISARLAVRLNPNIILDALPQKTEDAISYGICKSIFLMLQDTCKEKTIYFTGGDGKFFSKFFKNAIYDRTLIFRGMLAVIQKEKLKE